MGKKPKFIQNLSNLMKRKGGTGAKHELQKAALGLKGRKGLASSNSCFLNPRGLPSHA